MYQPPLTPYRYRPDCPLDPLRESARWWLSSISPVTTVSLLKMGGREMKTTATLLFAGVLLTGCNRLVDQPQQQDASHCFSITPGVGQQPYSPILLDACTGRSWLLVKGNKPDGSFTYQWFALERFETANPVLTAN